VVLVVVLEMPGTPLPDNVSELLTDLNWPEVLRQLLLCWRGAEEAEVDSHLCTLCDAMEGCEYNDIKLEVRLAALAALSYVIECWTLIFCGSS
jgi:hypothetical protein